VPDAPDGGSSGGVIVTTGGGVEAEVVRISSGGVSVTIGGGDTSLCGVSTAEDVCACPGASAVGAGTSEDFGAAGCGALMYG
jgi:hypothetical protein